MLAKENIDGIIDVIMSDEKLCTHIVSLVLKRLPDDGSTRQDQNLCEKVVDYTINQALEEINIAELLQILVKQAALKSRRQAILDQRQRELEKVQRERAEQAQLRMGERKQPKQNQQQRPAPQQQAEPRQSEELRPTYSNSEPQHVSPTAPRRLVQQLRKKAPLPKHMNDYGTDSVPVRIPESVPSSSVTTSDSSQIHRPNYSDSPALSVEVPNAARLNKTAPAKLMEPRGSAPPPRSRPVTFEKQVSTNSGIASTVDSEASTVPMGGRTSGGAISASDSSQDWLFQEFRSASSMSSHFEDDDYNASASPQPPQESPTRISPHMGVAMDSLPQPAPPARRISDDDEYNDDADPASYKMERADSSRLFNKDSDVFDESDFLLAYSKEDSAGSSTAYESGFSPQPKKDELYSSTTADPFNETIRNPNTLRDALAADTVAQEQEKKLNGQTEEMLRQWEDQVMQGLRSGDEEDMAPTTKPAAEQRYDDEEQYLDVEEEQQPDDVLQEDSYPPSPREDEDAQNREEEVDEEFDAEVKKVPITQSDAELYDSRDFVDNDDEDAHSDDLGMNDLDQIDDGGDKAVDEPLDDRPLVEGFTRSSPQSETSSNFLTNDTADNYATGIQSSGAAQKLLFFDQDKFNDFVDKQESADNDTNGHQKPKRRVSFPDDVVAEVYFREPVKMSEKDELFYNHLEEEQFMHQQGIEMHRAEALGMSWLEYMDHRSDEDAEREDAEGVRLGHDDDDEEFQYTGDFYESMDEEDENDVGGGDFSGRSGRFSAPSGLVPESATNGKDHVGEDDYDDEFEESEGGSSHQQQEPKHLNGNPDMYHFDEDEFSDAKEQKKNISPADRAVQQMGDDFSVPSYHTDDDDDSYNF